ncbi:MAG: PilZ domain-containing protein, partial [Gemmataceae bacterium]|nr:PilZ domain-containing protein [Gemmataceae bacterium]
RAAARLLHPNILRTLDFGLDGPAGYAVTEPPDGDPLARVVAERGLLAEADAARVVSRLADALAYAHAGGVVHGDVTAGRVVLRADGSVLLSGWGFAAAAGREATPADDNARLGEVADFAAGWADRTAGADRRAGDRHPVTPGLLGVTEDGPLGRWPVIVQDVSAGGVGLLIGRRVDPGTELRIAFGDGAGPIPARVVRVGAKAFGHWFHGCAFAAPLPAAALGELLRRADRAVVLT